MSAFATLPLHLDGSARTGLRTRLACELAASSGARVRGQYCVTPSLLRVAVACDGAARPDILGFLRAHGVEAEWVPAGADDAGAGEWLLSSATDFGADLLVMGAYGHARMREWIVGGATRTVLQSMTLPVLMAH